MDLTHLLVALLEDLTGQPRPLTNVDLAAFSRLDGKELRLGYSQLNELLLLFGYDRVSRSFFQYLVDGSTDYAEGAEIRSLAHLTEAVERFQKLALLLLGNVKFAFKTLARNADQLLNAIALHDPRSEGEFAARH